MERPCIEHIDYGYIGVTGAWPDVVAGVVPDEMLVPLFKVVLRINRSTIIMAILGCHDTQPQTSIDGPVAPPAVLVTNVHVRIDVLTLVSLVLLPLPVIVACSHGQSDMPAVEPATVLPIAQIVAQLHTEIMKLVGMGVLAPYEPRYKILHFQTPLVLSSQRNLDFDVWRHHTPQ